MKTFNFLLLSIVAIGLYSCGPKMIYPGEVWTDTEQNMINAHGGGVLYQTGRIIGMANIKMILPIMHPA